MNSANLPPRREAPSQPSILATTDAENDYSQQTSEVVAASLKLVLNATPQQNTKDQTDSKKDNKNDNKKKKQPRKPTTRSQSWQRKPQSHPDKTTPPSASDDAGLTSDPSLKEVRSQLSDYFEEIKKWATDHSIRISALSDEQITALKQHSAIVKISAQNPELPQPMFTQEVLNAAVAGIVTRHVWKHAFGNEALVESQHPQADTYKCFTFSWSLLGSSNNEAKQNLLLAQKRFFTELSDSSSHEGWQLACATRFSISLLRELYGLLTAGLLPKQGFTRSKALSELYIKGYKIGIQLHTSAAKWEFLWPMPGYAFDPLVMVNETQLLYGEVYRTMTTVMQSPLAHELLFAVTPIVIKYSFSTMLPKRSVVHNALVHIRRRW